MRKPYPSSVRRMSEIERAWVGAAIDSEGCLVHHYRGHIGIQVANSAIEFLSALIRATGIGNVYAQGKAQPQYTQCYTWCVFRKLDALDVAQQCRAYSFKCQQLLAA